MGYGCARYILVVKGTNLGKYADCFSITADPEVSKSPLFFLQSVQYFHRHYQMALCTVQATWKE